MSYVNPKNSLVGSSDVTLASPADGQVLAYSATSGKWLNRTVTNAVTNNVLRIAKNTDNTWPARPAGTAYVEWVGPGAPDPPYTVAGDTWVDTTS